jgi:tripartite-type tricarboxylate transporter receptor subunit TctC
MSTLLRTTVAMMTLTLMTIASAFAQDYPAKPVRVIVGAAAGSSGDVLGRLLADQLTQAWKQAVVIDNRPGAGGVIASQSLLAAPADGYTLMLAAGSYLTITPHTQPNLPYDTERDFTPIAMAGEVPLVFGVSPTVPAANLKELIAYAAANPGKIRYGANTPGTLPALATAYFLHSANVQMTYVPYKGASAALQDVMGGRLDMVVEGVSAFAGAFKSGALRPLAVTSTRRLPSLPEVPAATEVVPGYVAVGFFALMGQARLPEAIVKKVNADTNQVFMRTDIIERMAVLGNYARPLSPPELASYIRAEREVWGPVIKRTGFVAQ